MAWFTHLLEAYKPLSSLISFYFKVPTEDTESESIKNIRNRLKKLYTESLKSSRETSSEKIIIDYEKEKMNPTEEGLKLS